ncbi:MAG: hypothetical protein ABIQ27_04105 [Flavobacterium sp.]|uniref:hypothetical protein n=1 Tax=Flavobacterium sp. TaxID=239 RepID=UPI0032674997
MKNLLLITVFIVVATTKLLAQEKGAIEIKGLEKQSFRKNDENINKKENHQFEIVANENVDVNLKFSLKAEGIVNVLVTDRKDKVIFSKEFQKDGENRIAFAMEENEKYTIRLVGNNQSNLVVNVSEN